MGLPTPKKRSGRPFWMKLDGVPSNLEIEGMKLLFIW